MQFSKDSGIKDRKHFRFYIISQNDSTKIFETDSSNVFKKELQIFPNTAKVIGRFESSVDGIIWESVDYEFPTPVDTLKRIEVILDYTLHKTPKPFLVDFTIKYISPVKNVETIQIFEPKIGNVPIFKLINHGDLVFYGQSATNHFYGELYKKMENNWLHRPTFYCWSTLAYKKIQKGDTLISWLPTYGGDGFKIRTKGSYKYTLALGLSSFESGIFTHFYENAVTRKRFLQLYEFESTFEVNY